MPRFDGTGPRGAGPMTGRGEGYCVLGLPEPGRPVRGYAGLAGAPVGPEAPPAWTARRSIAAMRRGTAFGRGRGPAARRGHGRRW